MPSPIRALLLAASLALLVGLAPLAYGRYGASAQPGRLPVVTSTTVFVDLIQRVGGDRVDAFGLVPAGADVHTYQPTPQDLQRASRARVAVWNGLGLDQIAKGTVATLGIANLVTVTLSAGIEPIDGDEDEHEGETAEEHAAHAEGNPHLWLDPTLAMRYVGQIRDALVAADPSNAQAYRANADRYLAELAALDSEAESALAAIPTDRRKLVTFHGAFPYLARRYGMEVVAVVLRSPGREPSAQEVAELVTQIRAYGVPTVYTEPQFNARILELAARDAGVEVRTLYSDTLDNQVESYVDLMRYNVRALAEGLR